MEASWDHQYWYTVVNSEFVDESGPNNYFDPFMYTAKVQGLFLTLL